MPIFANQTQAQNAFIRFTQWEQNVIHNDPEKEYTELRWFCSEAAHELTKTIELMKTFGQTAALDPAHIMSSYGQEVMEAQFRAGILYELSCDFIEVAPNAISEARDVLHHYYFHVCEEAQQKAGRLNHNSSNPIKNMQAIIEVQQLAKYVANNTEHKLS